MKIQFPFSSCLLALVLVVPVQAAVHSHYSFDTDYTDTSGNGQDGSLTDVGTTGNSGITSTAGEYVFGGGAMDFSADRDYLAIPSHTFSSATSFTIAFWAKKASGDTGQAAQWDMVIGQRDNSNFFIALNDATGTGGRDGLRYRSNSSAADRQVEYVAPDDTAWHHYAITADPSKNLSFYLDGAFVSTAPNINAGIIIDTIGEAYTSGNDFDFHGQLDEMWLFDQTLDATEVSNLKTFNTIIPEPVSSALLGLAGLLLTLRRRR